MIDVKELISPMVAGIVPVHAHNFNVMCFLNIYNIPIIPFVPRLIAFTLPDTSHPKPANEHGKPIVYPSLSHCHDENPVFVATSVLATSEHRPCWSFVGGAQIGVDPTVAVNLEKHSG